MKRGQSTTLATFILVAAVTCLIAMPVMAGNQPPEGFKFVGPAIKAQITFSEGDYGGIKVRGYGNCQGQSVSFEPDDDVFGNLSDVTAESLLDNFIYMNTYGPPLDDDGQMAECIPLDAVGMAIRAVIDFQDEGTFKIAEVILLFAVPK